MKDIIQALLSGASDDEILEMVNSKEMEVKKNNEKPENNEQYTSCIKINGKPILSPVLTQQTRIECLEWKRKAMEVEEKLVWKRKQIITSNTMNNSDSSNEPNFQSKVFDQNENNLEGEFTDEELENESTDEETPDTYEILRCNSRAADKVVNGILIDEIDILDESVSSTFQERKEKDTSSMSKSGPKTFEEIKNLVKSMKKFSETSQSLENQSSVTNYDVDFEIDSDISDDETFASSIVTEEDQTEGFKKHNTSPFRTVISRQKSRTGPEYGISKYMINDSNTGLYDSILSVNTVIENPSFRNSPSHPPNEEECELENISPDVEQMKQEQTELEHGEGEQHHQMQRRGSYSIDKPSPLLLAYLLKIGEKEVASEDQQMLVQDNPKELTPSSKRELLDNYLTSLNNVPSPARQKSELQVKLSNQEERRIRCEYEDKKNYNTGDGTDEVPSLQLELSRNSSPVPTESSMTVLDSSTYRTPSQTVPTSQLDLQKAVSSLAIEQQESLQELLRMQEVERQKLREEFEGKQKFLIQEILSQFPELNSNHEGLSTKVVRNLEKSFSELEVCTPTEEIISCNSINTIYSPSVPRRVEISGSSKMSEYKCIQIPQEAYLPKYKDSWAKLTALAKGFLVRRLMATEKVQILRTTIQESVACAVQLHLESEGPPSQADLDLHSRLLAQLESACHSVHDIFFRLTISERMTILALNRRAVQGRDLRKQWKNEKKVSSATEARLKAKDNPTIKFENFNVRSRKAVRDAKVLKNNPALLGYAKVSSKRSRSPKRKSTQLKRNISSRMSTLGLSPATMPQPFKQKPTWK